MTPVTKTPRDACKRTRLTSLLALLTVAIATGCADSGALKNSAKEIEASQLGLATHREDTTTWPATNWWQGFNDEQLNQLIETARANNPSLNIAQARVRLAQQAALDARAYKDPQVVLDANATRERFSENYIYPPPLGGNTVTDARAALDFSYEFDFWGKQQAAIDAALKQVDAQRAETEAAKLVLSIAVAQSYFSLQRNYAELALTNEIAQQRAAIVALQQLRLQRGLISRGEIETPTTALATAQQDSAATQQRIDISKHQLAALTGQGPQALDDIKPATSSNDLTLPPPQHLPADLLGRRPDIAAQRARIEAANADISAARADFYPNIDLTAFFGLQALGANNLFQAGSKTYGAGPALHLPIFNRDRLRAQLGARYANYDLAIEQYNQTLLSAAREVADAGSTLQAIAQQRSAADTSLHALQRAYDIAQIRYRQGLTNHLEVLNANNALLRQQQITVELRDSHAQATLALIKALGGGYNNE